MSQRVKKPLGTLVLAAGLVLGLTFVGMAAQAAKSCKDDLQSTYVCRYVSEGKQDSDAMVMQFFNPQSDSPTMQISGTEFQGVFQGQCACRAKKPSPGKPDKVGFQQGKQIHCVVSTGTESATTMYFDHGDASYQAEPKKGKIQKGRAVDADGKSLVFSCEVAT